ncbi:MAG: hypothetical protein AAF996_01110 [Pseudomonadota bacterium]
MFDDAIKQMAELPQWVQLWMRWLNIVFLLGLFFFANHAEARWSLVAYVVAFPVGFLAFYFVRDIRMTGLPHIVFWTPLLIYLIGTVISDRTFEMVSLFGLWVSLLITTIFVCVILDVKGLIGVIFDRANA